MRARVNTSKKLAMLIAILITGTWWGVASSAPFHNQSDCTACHDFDAFDCGSYINIKAIMCTVEGQAVHFQAIPADYARSDGEGICQACHSSTHVDTDKVGEDCTGCHGGHCPDTPNPGDTGMFMTGGGAPDDAGHNFHLFKGSFTGNPKMAAPLDCEDCHEGGVYDELSVMVGLGVCNACHSPNGAYDGVEDPDVGAGIEANWADGVYEADGATLKAGKELWCAGCHDDEPAYSYGTVPTVTYVVVDNEDPEFVALPASPDADRWRCKEQSGAYNDTRCHNSPGTGSATATWTPNLAAGDYKVYARWVPGSSRATDAPYTITYSTGSVTVDVNQKVGGLDWEELTATTGPLPFAAGTSGSVMLSDDADGYVIADAVQFELQVPGAPVGTYAPDVIGDDVTYGFYVTGHNMDCLNCHDAARSHIDHKHRTYDSTLNNYQDGYRLSSINGAEPMSVPRRRKDDVYAVLADFTLCFKCHDYEEVLGQQVSDPWDVSHTNFWNNGGYPANLHTYHLEISDNKNMDSDFNGSGDTAPTCVGCHNVHGAPNQAMIRHGELINVNDKFPPGWAALNFSYVTSMGPPIVSSPTASLAASVGGIMDWAGNDINYNGTCKAACHGSPVVYERSAKLWPKVLIPDAEPDTVFNDGSDSTLLTAFVSDPDGDLSTVQVDLSSVGGSSAQTMYDDGLTGGDVTAGDGTYSYLHPIAFGTSEGEWSLLVTATDAATNTGTNTISLSVTAPGAIVVDNADAGFEVVPDFTDPDKWGCKAEAGAYGDGTRCHNSPGTGSATATWTPEIPTGEAGDYEVFAWWTDGSSRATDAPYTITYSTGSVTVDKNQKIDGSQWNSLGIYNFAAGTSGSIVLSDDADGYVIADAVRLEKQ